MKFMHHKTWENALFLHYEADPSALQALLPPGLVVDTSYNGKAFVGVVALSELGITPTFLPHWLRRLLALSHDAVNVRTYVRPENGSNRRPGIYFFTLDCSHVLPALGARLLFHLPYRLAIMAREAWNNGTTWLFKSSRRYSIAGKLEVEWELNERQQAAPSSPSSLAFFFVERYCLYNTSGNFLHLLGQSRLWRGSISHPPWSVQTARVMKLHNTVLDAVPGMNQVILPNQTPIAHFSPGVGDILLLLRGHASGELEKDNEGATGLSCRLEI